MSKVVKSIRVAAVQAAPIAFNRQKTIEKVAKLTAAAAAKGAKLVVFPESFIPGYPSGGFVMPIGTVLLSNAHCMLKL